MLQENVKFSLLCACIIFKVYIPLRSLQCFQCMVAREMLQAPLKLALVSKKVVKPWYIEL